MLKIKDNVKLEELEKYGIYPVYKIKDSSTGETYIDSYETVRNSSRGIIIKKKKYRISFNYYGEQKIIDGFELINLDILYDLIKDGLVEKVDE